MHPKERTCTSFPSGMVQTFQQICPGGCWKAVIAGGIPAALRSLEPLVMVRIHVGQPTPKARFSVFTACYALPPFQVNVQSNEPKCGYLPLSEPLKANPVANLKGRGSAGLCASVVVSCAELCERNISIIQALTGVVLEDFDSRKCFAYIFGLFSCGLGSFSLLFQNEILHLPADRFL